MAFEWQCHGSGGFIEPIGGELFSSAARGSAPRLIASDVQRLWIQLAGCAIVTIWCGGTTFVILWVMKKLLGLRVTKETESEGFDFNFLRQVVT